MFSHIYQRYIQMVMKKNGDITKQPPSRTNWYAGSIVLAAGLGVAGYNLGNEQTESNSSALATPLKRSNCLKKSDFDEIDGEEPGSERRSLL